jgi:hypothetical protein
MPPAEQREVSVTGRADLRTGRWTIPTGPPWRLSLTVGNDRYFAEADDLFDCLVAIRRELEREGGRVCCAGARPDVWPSGMARQMAGGRKAYRHLPGRRPTRADLVDVFDPTDCADVVTVAEQESAMRALRG